LLQVEGDDSDGSIWAVRVWQEEGSQPHDITGAVIEIRLPDPFAGQVGVRG
jgi:hypothetical protein